MTKTSLLLREITLVVKQEKEEANRQKLKDQD
jgi:hypothetical protein